MASPYTRMSYGEDNFQSNNSSINDDPSQLVDGRFVEPASDAKVTPNVNTRDAALDSDSMDIEIIEAPLQVDLIQTPDGGWGWMVVFGAFVVGILVDGIATTFGLMMMEMAEYYQVSKMNISWAGSVMNGVYLSIGPLVGGLCNKFGCRPIACIGAVIAFVGFSASVFSPNVGILILTYGFIGGVGCGLLYLPSIVMVGFYFERKRAFATGIAVCGSGVGAFVLSPLVEALLDIYKWRGTQLVLAGLVLNGVAAAMLFRPLHKVQDDIETIGQPRSDSDTIELTTNENPDLAVKRRKISVTVAPPEERQNRYLTNLNQIHQPMKRKRALTEGDIMSSQTITEEYTLSCDENTISRLRSLTHIPIIVDKARLQRELERPMYRKDIFFAGNVTHLRQYNVKHPEDYKRAVIVVPDQQLTEQGQQESAGFFSLFGERLQAITVALLTMLDFSVLKYHAFLLYGVSCSLIMLGFYLPSMFLPDDAVSKGMSRDKAAILLSVIGASNTVGRIACGWVSDQKWANCLIINNAAVIIGGMATVCVPFMNGNFYALCIYGIIFGTSIAIYVSLRSILMVELIGLDKLTSAFGMVTLAQGISSFVGAPLAGGLHDATGDYSVSFYFGGSAMILAGLVCIPCRYMAKKQQTKSEDKP